MLSSHYVLVTSSDEQIQIAISHNRGSDLTISNGFEPTRFDLIC